MSKPNPSGKFKWTHKRKHFVELLLADPEMNRTRAAMEAYKCKTEASASQVGYELMQIPQIVAAIAEAMESRLERTRITADTLLVRFEQELEADINDIYDAKGKVKPINQWPKIFRQGLVAGIDTDKNGNMKVRFSNRDKIKEMIGRHTDVQAFKDNVALSGKAVLVIEK